MTQVKICGLKDPASLNAAIEAGADFIGFVFYPPSPRNIELEVAEELAKYVPERVKIVGLFVEPEDTLLQQVADHIPLSLIQLHGAETPERVQQIKETYRLPVMKAIPIAQEKDLEQAKIYEKTADWLLFDTKTPDLGGSGVSFDWNILRNQSFSRPWMLAGGLNSDNIAQALSVLSPIAVDISSGVEVERGVKDPEKIKAFLECVRKLDKGTEND